MELQLGLALPIHSPMVKDCLIRFDHPDHKEYRDDQSSESGRVRNKRGFDEINGEGYYSNCSSIVRPKFVADNLLVWHGRHPNEGDDDGEGHKNEDSCPINRIEGDEERYIIGWPPIKSSRKKQQLLQRHGTWRARNVIHAGAVEMIRTRSISTAKIKPIGSSSSSTSSSANNNSAYVKVKMEGVAIARKVDLSLYQSYNTLKHTLLSMFSNYYQECIEDSERYTLTYQDKEGDWLLAGDVPWKSFIKSVQRLEIVRN